MQKKQRIDGAGLNDNDDAGGQPDQCERNPKCTRGSRHGGHGGRCSFPRPLHFSSAVAEAPLRHDAPSTSTQTCNRALNNDELVRLAVELRSCEASGITLHTLWKALRRLQSEIASPVPVVRGSPNSCSLAELASLLCFDAGGRTEEKLLTELKNAWERVKEPRKKHDQLQMRVVQWLGLWLQRGVTDLRRLDKLVRATRAEDPIARDAPPNAPGQREKRPKEEWGEEWGQLEIAEEARGVLGGRPAAEPPAAEPAAEPAVELGSPGGQFPLALLPAAGGGDEHDDEVEGASTQTCQICWGDASLVTTKTCNRALPPCPCPFTLLLLTRGFAFGAALIHCRGCNQARHAQCGEPPLPCLALGCTSPQLHVQCRERQWLCTACKRSRQGAKTASREEARKQQEEKQEAKKQME